MKTDLVITVIASAVVIGIFSGLIISLNNLEMIKEPTGGYNDNTSGNEYANGAGSGANQVPHYNTKWEKFFMIENNYTWTDKNGDKVYFTIYGSLDTLGPDTTYDLFLLGPVNDPDLRHHPMNTSLSSPHFILKPHGQISDINHSFWLTKDQLPTDGEYVFQAKYMGVKSANATFFIDGRK